MPTHDRTEVATLLLREAGLDTNVDRIEPLAGGHTKEMLIVRTTGSDYLVRIYSGPMNLLTSIGRKRSFSSTACWHLQTFQLPGSSPKYTSPGCRLH